MTADQPSPDARTDATEEMRLRELIQQVDDEHGTEGAASMADELRDRLPATKTEEENAGDRQN